jgi:hypothetical protein
MAEVMRDEAIAEAAQKAKRPKRLYRQNEAGKQERAGRPREDGLDPL